MTILVELSPEAEARLAAEAKLRGLALEEHASKILEQSSEQKETGKSKPTRESFHAMLDAIALEPGTHPKLPTSAFSRESFYEDRP